MYLRGSKAITKIKKGIEEANIEDNSDVGVSIVSVETLGVIIEYCTCSCRLIH